MVYHIEPTPGPDVTKKAASEPPTPPPPPPPSPKRVGLNLTNAVPIARL